MNFLAEKALAHIAMSPAPGTRLIFLVPFSGQKEIIMSVNTGKIDAAAAAVTRRPMTEIGGIALSPEKGVKAHSLVI